MQAKETVPWAARRAFLVILLISAAIVLLTVASVPNLLRSRIAADAAHPLIGAGRRISGPARLRAFEPPRVDILSTTEERAEQRNLGFCR